MCYFFMTAIMKGDPKLDHIIFSFFFNRSPYILFKRISELCVHFVGNVGLVESLNFLITGVRQA